MKIIDLLNKIAMGEEVPEKIKYKGDYWYLKQDYTNRLPYYSNGYNMDNLFTGEEKEYFSQSLNYEVEIIEEDKKIEKVHECFTSTDNKEIQFLIDNLNQLGNKINEIIDVINKGDK